MPGVLRLRWQAGLRLIQEWLLRADADAEDGEASDAVPAGFIEAWLRRPKAKRARGQSGGPGAFGAPSAWLFLVGLLPSRARLRFTRQRQDIRWRLSSSTEILRMEAHALIQESAPSALDNQHSRSRIAGLSATTRTACTVAWASRWRLARTFQRLPRPRQAAIRSYHTSSGARLTGPPAHQRKAALRRGGRLDVVGSTGESISGGVAPTIPSRRQP